MYYLLRQRCRPVVLLENEVRRQTKRRSSLLFLGKNLIAHKKFNNANKKYRSPAKQNSVAGKACRRPRGGTVHRTALRVGLYDAPHIDAPGVLELQQVNAGL